MPYENFPTKVDETPGLKYYCTCGESAKKPYCDGSHDRLKTGKSPCQFQIKDAQRYSICDCGTSKNPPFCDGSHSKK
jgi:CDGSH-type Zn-finger protein